jgi:hypothetical protein
MSLTPTKYQVSRMLGVSEDTVDNLIHQGHLLRVPGNRFVNIRLQSLADYTGLPLEYVIRECRLYPIRPTKLVNGASRYKLVVRQPVSSIDPRTGTAG